MTPQLQQAIRLLQLSTLELQSEVQEALESNPMLEQDEGSGAEAPEAGATASQPDKEPATTATDSSGDSENIPDELPTDSNWEDVFDTGATSFSAPEAGSGRDITETITVTGQGLHDHLLGQLELTHFSETDRHIARIIIDSIDNDGYLTTTVDEIHTHLDDQLEIERDEIERGQVFAKAGSIKPHTKFTARVYVLTKEEGGRHTPFYNGYRPQFYLRTTDVTGAISLQDGAEMIMPGDHVDMDVELITPIALEVGQRFAIREGGRTVGAGVINAVED